MKIYLILALLLCVTSISANQPGFTVTLRQGALDNLKTALIPWITEQMKSADIPNQSVDGIEFTDIHITELTMNPSQTAITLNDGNIEVTTNSLSLYVRGNAVESTIFGDLTDGFGVSTDQTNINEQITCTLLSNGSLSFDVPSANVQVKDLQFHVDGWLGDLADWILDELSSDIEDQLNPQLTSSFKDATLQALAQITAESSDTAEISDLPLDINFTPITEPLIVQGYASLGLDGTIFPNGTHERPPFSANYTLPQVDNNDQNTAQIFVGEYPLTSALWALQVQGFFVTMVTNDTLPPGSPLALDTTSLYILFPNLTKQYGEGQLVELNCSIPDGTWPQVEIKNGNVTVFGDGVCVMYAMNSTTNEYQYVLTMQGEFIWQMNATVVDAKYEITFHLIEAFAQNMTVTNSTIGNVNNALLEDKFNIILALASPYINKQLAQNPLPLPVIPNTKITEPSLYINDGYIEFTATPQFSPFSFGTKAEIEERRQKKYQRLRKEGHDIFGFVERLFW